MYAGDTAAFMSELWEGAVPISVSIAQSDCTSNESLDSVHVLVQRFNYLPLLLTEVVSNFQQNAIEFSSDVWFEGKGGVPLRCNLPAGVLFDLYANTEIPWELTVHFQHFPSQMLLKCATPSEIEHLYFHSLKQAVYLLHGSTRLFNELSVDAQRQLWQSVRISDHCAFLSVSEYLVNGGAESSAALRELKSLPIRVVRQDKPVVQRPVVPLLTSDAPTTSEARQKLLRDVLVLDLGAQLGISAETVDSFECVVHGIAVPMESPIFDLWKLMHHCDLFLYIIVRSALSS